MKHISEFQKHKALVKYICGYSPQELANELNVHFTTVYRWVSTWQKDLSCRKLTDLSIQDIGEILTYTEELRQQLIGLERSTAIIHESKVMQIIPMEQRIDMAVPLLDTYPVSTLCQTFLKNCISFLLRTIWLTLIKPCSCLVNWVKSIFISGCYIYSGSGTNPERM